MNTPTPHLVAGFPRLLGDVGGTHARFAWQAAAGAPLQAVDSLPTAGHVSLLSAAQHYLHSHQWPAPAACAIGIATPVLGDQVTMTNSPWSFSIQALQRALGVPHLRVLNDFTALALGLPSLGPSDWRQIGGDAPDMTRPVALIGPGTGLGVSGLLPLASGPGWVPIAGEGGHVTLSAHDADEEAVIRVLRARLGHVSAERVLSGPGLLHLHQAVSERAGLSSTLAQPADVAVAAAAGDARARQVLAMFFSFLGGVAGNLALTLGARGGVFVGGGIVPQLGEHLNDSAFRAAFEAKGRYRDYLAAIPVCVITTPQSPALAGASRALDTL